MKKLNLLLINVLLLALTLNMYSQTGETTVLLKVTDIKDTINRNIYGHFAEHLGNCVYGGIWVGDSSPIPNIDGFRTDIIDALKAIEVPVIRWPGGCFADTYHWKDGIGPKESRPNMVNFFWGSGVEDNSFGTHEFLNFCKLIGTEPYLAVNVGSGSVQEAAEWVEYVNSKGNGPMTELRRQNGQQEPWGVKYWGIGNESWGCGGNMDPYYYTGLYKQYATYCRVPYRIASGGLNFDTTWTATFMKNIKDFSGIAQGYSFHYYSICHTWANKGSATNFNTHEWYLTMKAVCGMQPDLERHIKVMDQYDPDKKIALIADEWGNWYDADPGTHPPMLYQQNTIRDAVSAAVYLNTFNNHCERVKMANIAQVVNVLQSIILTQDNKMVLTPTYYVFKMYKVHQNAVLIPSELKTMEIQNGDVKIPAVSVSSSKDSEGIIHITFANLDPENNQQVICTLDGLKEIGKASGEIITADKINAFNDFGQPEEVNIQVFKGFKVSNNELKITMPSKSVVSITIQ